MTCTVDFLFYTGYINNSDQIADTCEACDRRRVPSNGIKLKKINTIR